ncbi:MAG: hypothetical protein ACREPG_00160 [Candidatus Binatia bacterium]
MAQLFMLNPHKRRKARRNPRRMSAKQRKYFGPRRARANPARRARANPARRRRRARRNPAPLLVNARRRRRARRNPIARRRYRRNPALRLSTRGVVNQVTTAAQGALGATVVDVAMGYINPNLPANMLTANVYPIVKSGVAIGLGALGGMVGGTVGRFAAAGAIGSLTCTLHDVMRSFLPATLQLGFINSGYVAPRAMGAYVNGLGASALRTPLMGLGASALHTPLMGLGNSEGNMIESAMTREMSLYGPGYQALSAYVR